MPHSQDLWAVSAPAEDRVRPTPHLVELAQTGTHDLDEAKLRAPVIRPGSVPRTALVNRLRASSSYPVVTVLAPAGYGKTTLLAQWAERDPRPFAWLSSDDSDDPPRPSQGRFGGIDPDRRWTPSSTNGLHAAARPV